jgi:hypothetical protein
LAKQEAEIPRRLCVPEFGPERDAGIASVISSLWANFWRVPGIGFSELDPKRGGRPFLEEKFCHV